MMDPLMAFASRCRCGQATPTDCAQMWPRLFPGEELNPDMPFDELVDRIAERLALLHL